MAKNNKRPESDSVFVLKLLFYLIIGSQWVRIVPNESIDVSLPIGALLGLLFIRHDYFQINRRIEYAVLVVAMFIGFWLPMGLEIRW